MMQTFVRYFTSTLLLTGALALAPAALAQSTTTVQAESLFRDGLELMEAGDFQKACAAFEASFKLDPAVGTQLNLGRCYEKAGKIASAWSTFTQAATMAKRAGQAERAELARAQATRLRPLVPKVMIEVEGLQEDTEVTLDGEKLDHAVLQFAVPVDPGSHEVVVTFAGQAPLHRTFEAQSAEAAEPVHVTIGGEKASPKAAPEPAAAQTATESSSRSVSTDDGAKGARGWSTLRWVGVGVGAAGLVGVAVGSILGAKAMSDSKKADCDDTGCSTEGLAATDDAQSLLRMSYIVGVSGGVIAAGGITLFVLAPNKTSTEMALRAHVPAGGFSGLSLSGSF